MSMGRPSSCAAVLFLCACVHVPEGGPAFGAGDASFYGAELAGRPTASGRPFDPDQFTAAHRTLPFGTCVRVVDTLTNRDVQVEITDRGPHVAGRIIDLSLAAARVLGIIEAGVAPVRLYPCR